MSTPSISCSQLMLSIGGVCFAGTKSDKYWLPSAVVIFNLYLPEALRFKFAEVYRPSPLSCILYVGPPSVSIVTLAERSGSNGRLSYKLRVLLNVIVVAAFGAVLMTPSKTKNLLLAFITDGSYGFLQAVSHTMNKKINQYLPVSFIRLSKIEFICYKRNQGTED